MRKKVIAGNWKMNMTNKEAISMLIELKEIVKNIKNVTIIVGGPFTALSDAVKIVEKSNISIAAENVYPKDAGAFTGEISPIMLKEIGVKYVILGHSERREYFMESNSFINEKIKAVLAHGMIPILCIGERLEDREAGRTNDINRNQLIEGLEGLTKEQAEKIIIAYEPIWAIGTGKTATPEIAQETHRAIRDVLKEIFGEEISEKMTIQYGGSMNAENAEKLLSQKDIDGGLIGGASLKAESFSKIIFAGE
ncbi:MAG: triose-phosphate isomerase [Fusobacteriaceae bacterium]|jgi:triosephosphate isomerase|nr:triose-phosphate isomerase [Fusobacteriaceae bacterium]